MCQGSLILWIFAVLDPGTDQIAEDTAEAGLNGKKRTIPLNKSLDVMLDVRASDKSGDKKTAVKR